MSRPAAPPEDPTDPAEHQESRILAHSAVMAAGTVVSRISGLLRATLLVAALGSSLHADVFNVANTIPTMLYILLAGGVFNAVLVPQLVRALKNDADGGEAYTNRIITAFGLFLGGVTMALMLAAPYVVQLYSSSAWPPEARESLVDFTRYCLPQVFFYGIFVLVGQVLNARGRFGPMMWAPIANNVISVLVLVGYLVAFGAPDLAERCLGFSTSQELVLGIGSTIGIVAQCAILVPFLRAAGYTYRPRFDLRGTGLGHTLRLGVWTLLFVLVNQLAYVVVVKLATTGTATGCGAGGPSAGDVTGYTVYANSFLLVMVPHSVITVSLATALLPLLSSRAAGGDLAGLAGSLARTLRTALAVVVPVAALLPVVAADVAPLIFGWGAGAETAANYAPTLSVFGVSIVAFTVHYLVLRGFYALERNRTVFLIQCVVAAVNVAMALLLVGRTSAENTAPALAAAYGSAYAVGALASYTVLRRALGGLDTTALLGFVARLLVAVGAALLVALVLRGVLPDAEGSKPVAVLRLGVVGLADVLVLVLVARLVKLGEVTSVLGVVSRRVIPRPGRDRTSSM
ncbi:MAG: murein biosynthesis integral membrane protein MurJ [Nocardioides sp.]|nr:murein biosynthesis integral membrane protein MurJ [Nocardioides sp.]